MAEKTAVIVYDESFFLSESKTNMRSAISDFFKVKDQNFRLSLFTMLTDQRMFCYCECEAPYEGLSGVLYISMYNDDVPEPIQVTSHLVMPKVTHMVPITDLSTYVCQSKEFVYRVAIDSTGSLYSVPIFESSLGSIITMAYQHPHQIVATTNKSLVLLEGSNVVRTFQVENFISSIHPVNLLSKTGFFVGQGAYDSYLGFCDKNNIEYQEYQYPKSPIHSICADHKNDRVYIGYHDGLINVYNVKTKQFSSFTNPYVETTNAIQLVYGSHQLLSGSNDACVLSYDESKNQVLIHGHLDSCRKKLLDSKLSTHAFQRGSSIIIIQSNGVLVSQEYQLN